MRIVLNRRAWLISGWLLLCTIHQGFAQEGDLIGFKGGYKALSRLCEQNLDQASRLLANDYSRGYFVSLSIPAGADTINDISFLTATPPDMAAQITWALRGTNGQWIKKDKPRKFLVPIFFCQNRPPNDSLFSQLLVTNNVGFSVDHYPDQWPEAAEGVWLHPLTPLVASGAPREPQKSGAGGTGVAAPLAGAAVVAAPAVAAPSVGAPAQSSPSVPTGAGAATAAVATTAAAASPTGWPVHEAPKDATNGFDTVSASGIYKTKDEYDRGAVIFGSPTPVEQKGLLSWFTVDYAAFGQVRVKSATKETQEFAAGSIYGFRSNGVPFVYLKSEKQYMSVVYSSPSLWLVMDERKEQGYNGATNINGLFYYTRTLDGPLKEFTRKNIDADFKSNPQMNADMQILRKELNKHCITMTRGDFEACRELSKSYLPKWEASGFK